MAAYSVAATAPTGPRAAECARGGARGEEESPRSVILSIPANTHARPVGSVPSGGRDRLRAHGGALNSTGGAGRRGGSPLPDTFNFPPTTCCHSQCLFPP